jgi:hypothetical protein
MRIYYLCLLLLIALLAYTEHPKPSDTHDPSICLLDLNSSFAQLGVLAPVVLPQNEVFRNDLPQTEVFRNDLPQTEVFRNDLPQTEVLRIDLPQTEAFKSVPVYKSRSWSKRVRNVIFEMTLVFDLGVKGLTSTLIHGGEKLCWAVRIALECFQHILKMYTWSLSENQALVQVRCRLTGLFLKQSLYKKHDFAVLVHKLYYGGQNLHFWHLGIFSTYKNKSHTKILDEQSPCPKRYDFYGGGKALIFSSDELRPYALADLHEQQYQFLQCVKNNSKQQLILDDNNILCNVPIDVLAPKLTLKCIKQLATLHNMYMPSRILLKDAQLLLQDHKCQMCGDFLTAFQPYQVASNADYQRKWYQNNRMKRAEYNRRPEYYESHKKSSQKHYLSKKDVKFPPAPPSADLCQQIVSEFCADTSPDAFEETGCAVCGKLTPICEMEELSELENISLLKVDGITRKA